MGTARPHGFLAKTEDLGTSRPHTGFEFALPMVPERLIGLENAAGQAGFFINKKFIGVKLNGVNHHQDYAYVGNAMPKSSQWRDVKSISIPRTPPRA